MKEIKFRYWMHWKHNNDNGWMEYFELDPVKLPKLVHTGPKETINKFPHYFRNHVAESYNEDQLDYAIMQYTGLKDKNGKEIYEGDIVKYTGKDDFCIHEVQWDNINKCGFILSGVGKYKDYWKRDWYATQAEVIGSIYENQNLLETKNERDKYTRT